MNEAMPKVPQPAFDLEPVELLELQDEIPDQVSQAEFEKDKHGTHYATNFF